MAAPSERAAIAATLIVWPSCSIVPKKRSG
jgi:hypothetical protein